MTAAPARPKFDPYFDEFFNQTIDFTDLALQGNPMYIKPAAVSTPLGEDIGATGDIIAGGLSGATAAIEGVARTPPLLATAVRAAGIEIQPGRRFALVQDETSDDPLALRELWVDQDDLISRLRRTLGEGLENFGIAGEERTRDLRDIADLIRQQRDEQLHPSQAARIPYSWRWFAFNAPQAAGTLAPAVLTGGLAATSRGAMIVGSLVAGSIEAGTTEPEYRQKLLDAGYDEDEARRMAAFGAIGYGAAAGLVETFPLMAIFRKAPGLRARFFKSMEAAVKEGGEEAVQLFIDRTTQVLAGIDENALKNLTADELLQSFTLGGIAGGGFGFMTPGIELGQQLPDPIEPASGDSEPSQHREQSPHELPTNQTESQTEQRIEPRSTRTDSQQSEQSDQLQVGESQVPSQDDTADPMVKAAQQLYAGETPTVAQIRKDFKIGVKRAESIVESLTAPPKTAEESAPQTAAPDELPADDRAAPAQPGQAAGETKSKLDEFESAALERIAQRRRPAEDSGQFAGARGGSAPIFGDIADYAVVFAVRGVKAGIKGSKAIKEFVAQQIKTLGDIAGQINPFADIIAREAGRIMRESGAKDGGIDEAQLEQASERTRQRIDKATQLAPKTQIRESVEGKPQEPTITEAQALTAGLKAQAKAAREAFRAGVAKVAATIPIIKHELRTQAATRALNIEEVKNKIRTLVQKHIPPEKQGRFLIDVENATTPEAVDRAVSKMRLVASQFRYTDALRKVRNRVRAVKRRWRKLTNDRRTELKALMDSTEGIVFSGATKTITRKDGTTYTRRIRNKYDTAEAARDAAEILEKAYNRMGEIIVEHRDENRKFAAGKLQSRERHIKETVKNVESRKALTGRAKVMEDLEVIPIKRWFRGHLDVDNLTRMVERLWDGKGVLHNLIHRNMKAAEEKYNAALRDSWNWLDQTVRAAGFEGVSDALAKMSGTLGEANVLRIEVVVGGQPVSMTIGEAASIAAMDDQTVSQIADGVAIQLDSGRQRMPITITPAEIDAIRTQIGQPMLDLIDALKAYLELQIRPDLFKVHRRLKGWEPEVVPDYWPRARNMDASADVGLAEGWRGVVRKYLENAGFLKERGADKTPLLVKDLLTTFESHVDHALRVIHMAEPTRDADSVLRSQPVVQAINSRFGARMNQMLQNHLLAASMVNRDSVAGPDKILRHMNNNLVASFLTINEGTYLRQIGGLFKLAAHMDFGDFLAGLAGIKHGTIAEMKNNSGFIWSRYQGDSYSRFSPVRSGGPIDSLDAAGFQQSIAALVKSMMARDVRGASRSWERLIRSIKLLDWFDAIVARVAWEGYKARATADNPTWTPDQVIKWAAEQTSDAIRSTQNTSSPLDATTFASETRNSPLRFFLLFTTDPLKSANLIVRAAHQGPAEGAKAAAAVVGNILWSATITAGLPLTYSTLGALLGDNDDERKRQKRLEEAFHSGLWAFARDTAGTVYFGDRLIGLIEAASAPYKRDGFTNAPLGSAVSGIGSGISEITTGISKLSEGEQDEFIKHTLKGLEKIGTNGSALAGNPLLIPYYRGRRIVKSMLEDED